MGGSRVEGGGVGGSTSALSSLLFTLRPPPLHSIERTAAKTPDWSPACRSGHADLIGGGAERVDEQRLVGGFAVAVDGCLDCQELVGFDWGQQTGAGWRQRVGRQRTNPVRPTLPAFRAPNWPASQRRRRDARR